MIDLVQEGHKMGLLVLSFQAKHPRKEHGHPPLKVHLIHGCCHEVAVAKDTIGDVGQKAAVVNLVVLVWSN